MTTFRVHFADASHRDVQAGSPKEAAAKAQADHDCIVVKVKVLRVSR